MTAVVAHEVTAATPAILGGTPVRVRPMPPRGAFGPDELALLNEAIAYYQQQQVDPGYQGHFEKRYTDDFVRFMGGGYADAVSTGTAALYVSIAALDLPPCSEVIVSPITDPGTLSAIILNRLVPRLADSEPGSYCIGPEQFAARITPKVKGAVIVHSIGRACDIAPIIAEARRHGIKVLEDCSQAHGARVKGQLVGTFGDIAAFSTMYRKAHMTGASGGIVYTRDLELYHQALAHADRGKPPWRADFNDRDPNYSLFPALNHHTDELSCAIGIASLRRVQDTILRRLTFVAELTGRLRDRSRACKPYGYSPNDSPFVYPIIVDLGRIRCTKREFADAVLAEGVGLNPHYQYLVKDWPWIQSYLVDDFETANAREIRDRTFCLYLNENYGLLEATDIARAIVKVEKYFTR